MYNDYYDAQANVWKVPTFSEVCCPWCNASIPALGLTHCSNCNHFVNVCEMNFGTDTQYYVTKEIDCDEHENSADATSLM